MVVPGIEPGPPDLYPRTLTTRQQRRSLLGYSAVYSVHESTQELSSHLQRLGFLLDCFSTLKMEAMFLRSPIIHGLHGAVSQKMATFSSLKHPQIRKKLIFTLRCPRIKSYTRKMYVILFLIFSMGTIL
jgi:hypothetical protein